MYTVYIYAHVCMCANKVCMHLSVCLSAYMCLCFLDMTCYGRADGRTNACTDGWRGGGTDGRTADGWMDDDGQMYGWMDLQMDGFDLLTVQVVAELLKILFCFSQMWISSTSRTHQAYASSCRLFELAASKLQGKHHNQLRDLLLALLKARGRSEAGLFAQLSLWHVQILSCTIGDRRAVCPVRQHHTHEQTKPQPRPKPPKPQNISQVTGPPMPSPERTSARVRLWGSQD